MVDSTKMYQAAKDYKARKDAGNLQLTKGVTKRSIGGTVSVLPDGTTITETKYIYSKDGVAVVGTETSTKTPIYSGSSSRGHDIKPVTEVTGVTNPIKETVIRTDVNAGSSIQRALGYKPKVTETTRVKIGSNYYTKIGKGDKALYFSDKAEYYGDRNILQKQTSKFNEQKLVTPLKERVVSLINHRNNTVHIQKLKDFKTK